jgi:membrane associated rhomboid family serine protease
VAIEPLSVDPGPRRRFPFVNYALILANIIVIVVEITQGSDQAVGCFQADYSVIPYNILHGISAMPTDPQLGLASCPAQLAPYTFLPVYLTLITSMFLHANLLHIGGNMLYLWIFGDNVEDRFGHLGYLVFYLFCGLAAGATQIAATAMLSPGDLIIPNLGASGAIAGVLAAYLIFFPGARVRSLILIGVIPLLLRLRAFVVIGVFFLLQILNVYLTYVAPEGGSAAAGGVAYFAHIGGFVSGFVITLLLRPFIKAPAARQATPAYPQ